MALIYNSSTTAATTAAEIAAANNVKTAAYQANVSVQTDIEQTIQQIVADFDHLDIIVVNSGITSNVPAEDYTPAQWSEIMRVNLDGAFYTAQAAARVFKTQRHGNVIFTASVSATLVNVPQKQAAVSTTTMLTSALLITSVKQRANATDGTVVQRVQSRGGPAGEVPLGRMGGLLPRELHLAGFHRDGYPGYPPGGVEAEVVRDGPCRPLCGHV